MRGRGKEEPVRWRRNRRVPEVRTAAAAAAVSPPRRSPGGEAGGQERERASSRPREHKRPPPLRLQPPPSQAPAPHNALQRTGASPLAPPRTGPTSLAHSQRSARGTAVRRTASSRFASSFFEKRPALIFLSSIHSLAKTCPRQ